MKIVIGCDHAGFELKSKIITHLSEKGFEVEDMGCYSEDSIDYADYAHPVASKVEDNSDVTGILICGSGNGINMTANKHQGIRSALCWTPEISKLSREHSFWRRSIPNIHRLSWRCIAFLAHRIRCWLR
jgi:ribose 5-phosphate isomerase B